MKRLAQIVRSWKERFSNPDAPRLKRTTPPELYLHIGLPKTGTSAIQQFLFSQKQRLQTQHGIHYPDQALHWQQHVALVKSVIGKVFPHAHFNPAIAEIDGKAWLAKAVNQCQNAGCDKMVISSEFFWAAPAMQLGLAHLEDNAKNLADLALAVQSYKELFAGFAQIKVIVYLRRQDDWLESFFNQQLKDGFGIPTEEELLAARIYLFYAKNLKLWVEAFGRENLCVRGYDQISSNIVADFCHQIGLDELPPQVKSDQGPVNARLSPRALKIMREVLDWKTEKAFKELLREVLTTTSSRIPAERYAGEQGVFSQDFLDAVAKVYAEDNRLLAQSFPEVAEAFCQSRKKVDQEKTENRDLDSMFWEEKVEHLLEELVTMKRESTRDE